MQLEILITIILGGVNIAIGFLLTLVLYLHTKSNKSSQETTKLFRDTLTDKLTDVKESLKEVNNDFKQLDRKVSGVENQLAIFSLAYVKVEDCTRLRKECLCRKDSSYES